MLPEGDKISDLTRPHGSRFRDALAIVNPGACNPSGIAQSIIDACREVREHEPKVGIAQDPAIRLMVYQLARLRCRRLRARAVHDRRGCLQGTPRPARA